VVWEWEIDEDEATELLTGLIAIESVNPSLVPGGSGELEVARYIADYLRSVGLPVRLDEVVAGRPNVVAAIPPGNQGGDEALLDRHHGLILNGHTDTVSIEGMAHHPLRAPVRKGKVYGRGAFDMKGGVAMALLALAAVKRADVPLRRSVLFTGVMDEEYASLGTQDVVKRYTADAAIVTEPTGLTLHLAHKGFAWVAVETTGLAAHGSRPQEGIDAITKMGKLLVAVERLDQSYLRTKPHPLLGHPSIHASIIQGGREMSTYPDRCVTQFERRTLPGEDPAVAAEELDEICRRLAAEDRSFRAKVTLGLTRSAYEVDRNEGIVQALASAFRAVTRRDPEYGVSSAWLDSAILGEAGIPTVIFGPDGAGPHTAREYVTLSSVMTGAKVLAEVIVQFCG